MFKKPLNRNIVHHCASKLSLGVKEDLAELAELFAEFDGTLEGEI
jgi:hypothetical protein